MMAETGAVFGGEHSAHYYFARNFNADSGLIASLMVMAEVGRSGALLSETRASRSSDTRRAVRSTRRSTTPLAVIDRVSGEFADHPQDDLDGLTVDCGDWWFNLRPVQHRTGAAAQPRSTEPRRVR